MEFMSSKRRRIHGRRRVKRTPFKLNLNSGTDVDLIDASTAASKANTPKDLSEVHKRIASASTGTARAVAAALPGIISGGDKVVEGLVDS